MGYTACQFKRLRRGNLQIAPLELHRVPANDISKTSSAKVYPSFLHPYILMAFDRTELIRCGVAQQWNKYTGYSQGKECLLLVKAVPMSLFFKTGVPTSHGFLSFFFYTVSQNVYISRLESWMDCRHSKCQIFKCHHVEASLLDHRSKCSLKIQWTSYHSTICSSLHKFNVWPIRKLYLKYEQQVSWS